jgi:hypothetical protein
VSQLTFAARVRVSVPRGESEDGSTPGARAVSEGMPSVVRGQHKPHLVQFRFRLIWTGSSK